MKKDFYIRTFGIRVPIMVKNQPDLMYYKIWTHRTIVATTNDVDDPIKKKIPMPDPVIVDRYFIIMKMDIKHISRILAIYSPILLFTNLTLKLN